MRQSELTNYINFLSLIITESLHFSLTWNSSFGETKAECCQVQCKSIVHKLNKLNCTQILSTNQEDC